MAQPSEGRVNYCAVALALDERLVALGGEIRTMSASSRACDRSVLNRSGSIGSIISQPSLKALM
ncbi:hypothetical protein D3C80_2143860 [compost metagenome]